MLKLEIRHRPWLYKRANILAIANWLTHWLSGALTIVFIKRGEVQTKHRIVWIGWQMRQRTRWRLAHAVLHMLNLGDVSVVDAINMLARQRQPFSAYIRSNVGLSGLKFTRRYSCFN